MPNENLDVTLHENVLPVEKPEPMSVTLERGLDRSQEAPNTLPVPARTTEVLSRTESVPAGVPGERPRDSFGRFAPKEGAETGLQRSRGDDGFPTPIPAAGTAPAPATSGAEPSGVPEHIPPPASWAPDLQVEWGRLPAPVKQYMAKREGELQAGFQTIHQRVEISKAILNEFTPYAADLDREGATPVTAIRTLLQTAKALRDGGAEYKKAIVLSLAQQYGVDLSQPLNVELAQAQAQAGSLQIDRMYQLSGQTTQAQQDAMRAFNAFAADPANEFFQAVRGIMGQIITANPNASLKDAYEQAVWVQPDVRKVLLQRQEAQWAEGQKRKGAANLSVTGGPNGTTMVPSKPGRTGLRDSIEAAFGSTDTNERV